MMYFYTRMIEASVVDLKGMREKAGLTVREFARELGTYHTNVLNWERDGRITKTEFVVPASSILGVTVDELLGLPKTRSNPIPGGKLGQLFRDVAELPRSQQERIMDVVEDMLTAQRAKAS